MPAVSWPSEASFSVWINRSCAASKLLEGFRQFPCTGLNVLEQARILDSDHGLRRKGLEQIDRRAGKTDLAPFGAPQVRRRRGLAA